MKNLLLNNQEITKHWALVKEDSNNLVYINKINEVNPNIAITIYGLRIEQTTTKFNFYIVFDTHTDSYNFFRSNSNLVKINTTVTQGIDNIENLLNIDAQNQSKKSVGYVTIRITRDNEISAVKTFLVWLNLISTIQQTNASMENTIKAKFKINQVIKTWESANDKRFGLFATQSFCKKVGLPMDMAVEISDNLNKNTYLNLRLVSKEIASSLQQVYNTKIDEEQETENIRNSL